MVGCPSDEELAWLLEGRLTGAQAQGLQEHVRQCFTCVELLTQLFGGKSAAPAGLAQTLPLAPSEGTDGPQPPWQIEEYRIERPLGRGAMGEVYLARDTRLDRPVAIKFLSALEPDAAARERFLTEARAIARLAHPNVVAIYRVGELAGRPYLVSEYVRGQTLDALPRPLPWERVLRIGVELARGLGAAHRRDVLHRDIKPQNAILTDEGRVKLLDFGLAKLLNQPDAAVAAGAAERGALDSAPSLTRSGALLGTPMFIAPELWLGEPATRQSDVYALGAVLYELCAGRTPYTAATLRELRRLVEEQEPAALLELAPDVDPRLADVVDRCLLRSAADRFSSGDELCQALERLLEERRPADLPAGNPYRGLSPFEAEHRGLFYGRAVEIRAVVDLLRVQPMVLVAGDSGVGKSSLCRGGVLARVREGAMEGGRAWSVISLVPGRRPLDSLAHAVARALERGPDEVLLLLRHDPSSLLRLLQPAHGAAAGTMLFIDQLEELLTQSKPGEAEVTAQALGQLCAGDGGVRLLMTARGDHLTRLAQLPVLGGELARSLYFLRPLTKEGLREAIVGPAESSGFRFESDELVEELVDSTVRAEGSLPLLQFALAELWEGRDVEQRRILAAALERAGGVAGALARHADGVLASLLPTQRRAAQRMLLRLVTAEGLRVQRPAPELAKGGPDDAVVLEALVRGRMVVARVGESGEAEYELAHEALLRGWGTLRRWLEADVEGRAARERVETAAADWERLGRARDALWGEAQLKEVEKVTLAPAELPSRPVDFLAASRRHLFRRRWLRRGVLVGLLSLPFALALAGLQRQRTEEITRAELGGRALSLAQLPGSETGALVAGIQATAPGLRERRPLPVRGLEGLSAAVGAGRRSLLLRGHTDALLAAAFSPDGQRLLTASADGTARVWDAHTGQPLLLLRGHNGWIWSAAFSPDGSRLATAGDDGAARLWDARTGETVHLLQGHKGRTSVSLSPDGGHVLTTGDNTARVWDARTGQLLHQLKGHTLQIRSARFSPDGTRIFTAGDDARARIWDARTAQLHKTIEGRAGWFFVATAFSPDGASLVTGGRDGAARVWDARTGELRATLKGHEHTVVRTSYSPDGFSILTADDDGLARVWDARTGQIAATLAGHGSLIRAASFSPDGRMVLTASVDATARLWDAHTGREIALLQGHAGPIGTASFSPDGRSVVTAGFDAMARLWSIGAGLQLVTLAGHTGSVSRAAPSPDGGRVVTAAWDNTARVWDARTGQVLAVLRGHAAHVSSAAFSPDGRSVVTASQDSTARGWDAETGQLLLTLQGHSGLVYMARYSPFGRRIVTAGEDKTARVWDAPSGRLLLTLTGHPDVVAAASFSPDGRRLVSTSGDTARVWDAQNGQPVLAIRHSDALHDASFSVDGTRIVFAGHDGNAGVWDARTGRRLLLLSGHLAAVLSAEYSPDGMRIVTAGDDRTVRVWDASTGRPLLVLWDHTGGFSTAAFFPDGQRIVTANPMDRSAKIYAASLEQMLTTACGLLRYQPELAQVRSECEPYSGPSP